MKFADSLINGNSLPNHHSPSLTNILNIFFVIVGALAFLMLVIAGFRYIISGGSPDQTKEAKNMIIYAFVGLLIIAFAAAIVNFVIGKV